MKPREETWEAWGLTLHLQGAREIIADFAHDTAPSTEHEDARAKLAACAPEMARMLLEQYVFTGDSADQTCPTCCMDLFHSEHADGCELQALLKKAGIL